LENDTLKVEETAQERTNKNQEQKDEGEKVKKINKKVAGATKKKVRSPSKHFPQGFSMCSEPQKAGPKPICRGCKMPIEYTELCVHHGWYEASKHRHLTKDQYHCRASCLAKMEPKYLCMFMTTKIS